MPGNRMVWVYSARPVTFSRASRRGNERPTCPPRILVVGIADLLRCLKTPLAPSRREGFARRAAGRHVAGGARILSGNPRDLALEADRRLFQRLGKKHR